MDYQTALNGPFDEIPITCYAIEKTFDTYKIHVDIGPGQPNVPYHAYIKEGIYEFALFKEGILDQNGGAVFETRTASNWQQTAQLKAFMEYSAFRESQKKTVETPPEEIPSQLPKTCLLLALNLPFAGLTFCRGLRNYLPGFTVKAYYQLSMFLLTVG